VADNIVITSVEMHTDMIPWSSNLPTVDPDWEFTDSAGHVHTATSDTMVYEQGEQGWCGQCGDYHADFGNWCAQCGEELHPKLTYGASSGFMPGATTLTLTGTARAMLQPGQTVRIDVPHVGSCDVRVVEVTLEAGRLCSFRGDAVPVDGFGKSRTL
jgi:hypothetical protein